MILRTIDAHAGGEPLRLVVEGFPAPRGKSMLEKRLWVKSHSDVLRRQLMMEPRGHLDMCGAVLTEPVSPGSHAGLLFMDHEGYGTMSGHGIIAVTTIALERRLVTLSGNDSLVVCDTPAGTVRARATCHPQEAGTATTRVDRVAFLNVPSFVLHGALPLKVRSRNLRADVAFGGAFYAIVDSEAAGVGINGRQLPELRRVGMEIRRAIEEGYKIVHPLEPQLEGVAGAIFTGPPSDSRADLRSVTVFADGAVDRSPGGTGTSAIMAVLNAMGLLEAGVPFVHESVIGTRFSGRVADLTAVGEHDAIVPEIEGSASITGDHVFLMDDADPFREGFTLT
jgi:proline racemase